MIATATTRVNSSFYLFITQTKHPKHTWGLWRRRSSVAWALVWAISVCRPKIAAYASSCFNHKVLDHGFLRNLNTKQKGCRKQITRLTGYWLDLELVLLVGWYSQIRFLHIPALKEAVLESLVVEKGSSKIRCSNSPAFRSYQKFRYLVQWAPCQGLWMKADGDPKSSWDLLTS